MATWARNALTAFRASLTSISDPGIARLFGWSAPNYAGVEVTEGSALGLSAVWRATNLIGRTLAQLPLKTYRETANGARQQMTSVLDDPGKPIGLTPFDWKALTFTHLLLHGNAYLRHIYGGAGQLLGLQPLHPMCVCVRLPRRDDAVQPVGGKWFDLRLLDGTHETHDASTLTHVMGFSVDGIIGLSPIAVARNSLGTAIAGDRAAATMFSTGALASGMVTPADDDADWTDSKAIKDQINQSMTGWDTAGGVAVINRKLKFTQFSLSAVDAQFLQSRQFSIEEIARWFGVPPFELMQTDKQTSWGTGIEAQQRGLGRTTLAPWATSLEQALSRLLAAPRWVEFEFAALERPTPDQEIALLIQQVDAGLLTLNEARAIRNMPPVEGGDTVRGTQPAPAPAPAQDEAVPANA